MKAKQESPSSQAARRRRLVTLAALNLVLWLVVAGAVVLLVSRRVDLGVETFFREGPATFIASLLRPGQPTAGPVAGPTVTLTPVAEVATGAAGPATTAELAEGNQTPEPSTEDPAGATPSPVEARPTPEPSRQAVSYPLNLSDPVLERVLEMEADMDASAVGRRVQIDYSEEALNREIARFLQRYPFLPYRRVGVELHRDSVVVRGDVTLHGITASVEVEGRVEAANCRPWAEIDTLSIAGMPTPGLFREGITLLLQDALSWYPPDHPLCVEWIIVEEDQVSFFAVRR